MPATSPEPQAEGPRSDDAFAAAAADDPGLDALQKTLAEHLGRVVAAIRRDGHAVQCVLPEPGSPDARYAYTVGLSADADRGYELAVTGLAPAQSVSILNGAAAELAAAGPPRAGLCLSAGLRDYWVQLRPATDPTPFSVLRALFGGTPAVWQVVWPDVDGRFPDDRGYRVRPGAQPML